MLSVATVLNNAPTAHAVRNLQDTAFEWAGVFAVDDSSHTWSMQAVDGEYADATMRLVLFPTDSPTAETMESLEDQASSLMEGESCAVIEDGESMSGITAEGSCFELHVGTGDDSTFAIDTSGITGLAVYAQHIPIEFERDRHYLYDSSDVDIEPIAQESAGGDHGHSHDHDHEELECLDFDAASAAEQQCKAANGCSECSDFN
eukprot:SAG31_NODE_6784_length_1889_cov_70.125698_1_plen_203_part_10